MKTFKDLMFEEHDLIGGVRASLQFENGYGVSVVSGSYTYGGSDGLYELAVLNENGGIAYDTHITDGVLGYLKPEEVTKIMQQIQLLK